MIMCQVGDGVDTTVAIHFEDGSISIHVIIAGDDRPGVEITSAQAEILSCALTIAVRESEKPVGFVSDIQG